MEYKFVRLPTVKQMTGKPKSSIYKDIKEGKFPRPLPIGKHSVAWLESEIHKWQEEKIRER